MSLEEKLTKRQIAHLESVSVRSIGEWIRLGKFPKPDFPAHTQGASHRWLSSTVERWRAERAAAAAPPPPQRPPRTRSNASRAAG